MARPLLQIENLFGREILDRPVFDDGRLVYEESRHTLTHLDGFYVCSQKQRKLCEIDHGKNISVELFERRFTKHFKQITLDRYKFERAKLKLTEEFIPLKRDRLKRIVETESDMARHINNVHLGIKLQPKANPREVALIRKDLEKLLWLNYPEHLLLMCGSFMEAFAEYEDKKVSVHMSRLMFDKVYIKNNGAIVSIKLESLVDYLFIRLKKEDISFMKGWTIPFVDPIKFNTANFKNVCEMFEKENYKNVLSYELYKSTNSVKSHIDSIFSIAKNESTIKQVRYWNFLKDFYSKLGLIMVYTQLPDTYKELLASFKSRPQ